jgi:hypothetical protein
MIFKAFNPLEYFEHEVPPESSDWGRWINGEELTFKSEFAQYCWWQILQINDDFIDWDGSAKHYAKYIGDPVDGELDEFNRRSRLLTQDFDEAVNVASLAISSVKHPSQFEIDGLICKLTTGDQKRFIQSLAAYALICFDTAIAALKNNDASIASEFFMYATGGMHLIEWYKKNLYGKAGPLSASDAARRGGHARRDRDPRTLELLQVNECWNEWQASPSRYKSKSDFARDMLDKYTHLISEKTITDLCRKWEKANRRSAG